MQTALSLAATDVPPYAVYAAVSAMGVLGGYVSCAITPKLMDTCLAALGAAMLARVGLQYYSQHADTLRTAYPPLASLPLEEHGEACVLGGALALLIMRGVLLTLRSKLFGTRKESSSQLFGEESLIAS